MIGETSSAAGWEAGVTFSDIYCQVAQDQFAEEEEVVKVTGGVCSGEGMEDDNGLPFYADRDGIGGTLPLGRKVGPRSKEIWEEPVALLVGLRYHFLIL